MHKRGQSFTVWGPPQSPCAADNSGCAAPPMPTPGTTAPQPTPTIYLNTDWAEPKPADPQLCLDSTDRSTRTIRYCADYVNGVSANADVKRKSTSPSACTPTKCALGPIGNMCTDDSGCMNIPGSCDACPVKGGFTTDDEMMILLGLYYSKPTCP